MQLSYHVVNFSFKHFLRTLCRVDDSQWVKVPDQGPLIIAINHINFLEIPIMYTHLLPRQVTAFVKSEGWKNPFLRYVFNLWDGIPLQRGEADMHAIRAGLAVLNEGKILGIAPEGRRTGDGRLIEGYPGIVTMALKAQVPILPMVSYGHEHLWANVKRLQRTPFHVKIGRLFTLNAHGRPLSKQVRRQMTDELMFQLARLLPEDYRGYYADLSWATEEFIEFAEDNN